jgi:hypothetical protein
MAAEPKEPNDARRRRRACTALGWVSGGCAGVLASYGLFLAVGTPYPTIPATFVLFVGGAFLGMAVADRLGPTAFRGLGITTGVLLALVVATFLAVVLTH